MRLDFLKPSSKNQPWTKIFAHGRSDKDLLRVSRFDSVTIYLYAADGVSPPSPEQLHDCLKEHAEQGYGLLMGRLTHPPLQNETRGGNTIDPTLPTDLFTWDVEELTFMNVISELNEMLDDIPELRGKSYVLQWSSKQGIIDENGDPIVSPDKPRFHLYIIMDKEMPLTWHEAIHKTLSFKINALKNQFRLNDSKTLEYPLDLAPTSAGTLLIIAQPVVQSPFQDTLRNKRWELIDRSEENPDANLPINTDALEPLSQRALMAKFKEKESGLRALEGLEARTKVSYGAVGGKRRVDKTPSPTVMTFIKDERGFSYYDMGDGDSGSYYHPIENPHVIGTFKDPEAGWLFKKLDPDAWRAAVDRAEDIRLADTTQTVFTGFLDPSKNKLFSLELDNAMRSIQTQELSERNLTIWLEGKGLTPPEIFPSYTQIYDPTADYMIDRDRGLLNQHIPSEVFRLIPETIKKQTPSIDMRGLEMILTTRCPALWDLVLHVAGGSTEVALYFFNWVAYMLKTGQKPQTAFIFSGTNGTGKNNVERYFLQPLFGIQNIQHTTVDKLDDSKNGWIDKKQIVIVNESESHEGKYSKAVLDICKDLITDENSPMRAMYRELSTVRTYMGFLFLSNHAVPVEVEERDRRFNVAPYQPVPLKEIKVAGLDVEFEWDKIVQRFETEVQTFAEFLYEYDPDVHAVKHTVENEAKEMLKENTRKSHQHFFHALINGKFEKLYSMYITLRSKMAFGSDGPDNILAESVSGQWLASTVHHQLNSADEPQYVPLSLMNALYCVLAEQNNMSASKFRVMAMHNHAMFKRRPGFDEPVLEVNWELSDERSVELASEFAVELEGLDKYLNKPEIH